MPAPARLRGNVSVAGFRCVGHDAEGHEFAFGGQRSRDRRRLLEGPRIAHDMIGGRHEQNRLRIDLQRLQRGQRHRRCGVSARGLEQYRARLVSHRANLFRHREAMRLIAHDDRIARTLDGGEARHRVLQHGVLARQRQQLFRIHFSG